MRDPAVLKTPVYNIREVFQSSLRSSIETTAMGGKTKKALQKTLDWAAFYAGLLPPSPLKASRLERSERPPHLH